jgi:Holliday junction resolvasome RuvABC endonuclease subunit
MPKILALDTGNITGWAFGDTAGGPPECGTWDMPPVADGLGIMCASYADVLHRAIAEWRPDLVAMEEVMPATLKSAQASWSHMSISAITQMICYRSQVPLKQCHLSKIRSAFIGRTVGDKREDVIDKVKTKRKIDIKDYVLARAIELGCEPDSTDASDACAVFFYARKFIA